MNEIIQLISSVGFPISMCLIMGWYIAKKMDANTQALLDLTVAIEKLLITDGE